MHIKIYSEERCPSCGRLEVSERVNRNILIRLFLPDTRRMKCRRCLTRYLVRMEEPDGDATSGSHTEADQSKFIKNLRAGLC